MTGRRDTAALFVAAVVMAALVPHSAALSWRLFAGREECFTEYMSDAQWKYVQSHLSDPQQTPVFVDLGFLVTSKYGTEESQAAVDYALYTPAGGILKTESGVSEGEFGGQAKGGRGPWRVCFRVSSGALLRPSVTVQLNYFLVTYEEYLQDGFEWENENEHHAIDPKDLGTKEQIESLEHGLLRLDHYLLNVTHEQRFLYSRTVRHLRTAESTLRRTFWYYSAIYSVICLASFSQLVAVRVMFRKSRKQGLII